METSRAGWVKMEQSDRCRNQHLWISWGKKTQSSQRGNCSIKSRISADLLWLPFDALPFSRRDTIRGFAAKLNRIEWAPEIKISYPREENLWISADLKKSLVAVMALVLQLSNFPASTFHMWYVIMLMLLCNSVSPVVSWIVADWGYAPSPVSRQEKSLHYINPEVAF